MNKLSLFLILIFVISCAKPADPTKSPNPVYGSITATLSGVETPCENCLMFEASDSAVRVTFSDNGVEECSGQGTLSYLSNESFVVPEELEETTSWTGQVTGDNSSKDPFCFPDQLVLDLQKKGSNFFELSYNGKEFRIRKLN